MDINFARAIFIRAFEATIRKEEKKLKKKAAKNRRDLEIKILEDMFKKSDCFNDCDSKSSCLL